MGVWFSLSTLSSSVVVTNRLFLALQSYSNAVTNKMLTFLCGNMKQKSIPGNLTDHHNRCLLGDDWCGLQKGRVWVHHYFAIVNLAWVVRLWMGWILPLSSTRLKVTRPKCNPSRWISFRDRTWFIKGRNQKIRSCVSYLLLRLVSFRYLVDAWILFAIIFRFWGQTYFYLLVVDSVNQNLICKKERVLRTKKSTFFFFK